MDTLWAHTGATGCVVLSYHLQRYRLTAVAKCELME